jgi:hypothetical protein
MAYDGWIEFNGTEIVNLSRTAQLAGALGIDSVWITPGTVQWIEDARGGVDYDAITEAPWYDASHPASMEFAGIVPLGFPGLDDSTTEASTTEYVTDGGRSGQQRNATLPIVASVALVASTDRGAEYGKRWLDRILRASAGRNACSGSDLRYMRYKAADAPVAHRRQVRLTRGTSVTRKRSVECSVTWLATFTLTCDDPFEYGEPVTLLTDLGGLDPEGDIIVSGSLALVETSCPVYDYTPIYDPLHPALVASPTAPEFYPAGWNISEGMTFDRFWARLSAPEPHTLNVVPVLTLTTDTDARMVRVSVWPGDSLTSDQCGPLFSVVVSYLPAGDEFIIDGEQKAAYVWDGVSDYVRRTDSLVYSPDAKPVEWTAFNDPDNLLVTLDVFTEGSGVEGDGDVRLSAAFTAKSD